MAPKKTSLCDFLANVLKGSPAQHVEGRKNAWEAGGYSERSSRVRETEKRTRSRHGRWNNMSKIKKGLKNNAILEEPIQVDHEKRISNVGGAHAVGARMGGGGANGNGGTSPDKNNPNPNGVSPVPATPSSGGPHFFGNNNSNNNNNNPGGTPTMVRGSTASGFGSSTTDLAALAGAPPGNQLGIMPSGPRISDWCYSAPSDSIALPVVKSRELYENVRLLGRGAFGEVSLVKNIEDNKL